MLAKLIKMLLKLFGGYWLAKTMQIKLHEPLTTLQAMIAEKTKHIGWVLLLICIWLKLVSLSFNFFLLGLSTWINVLSDNGYVGFFISSILAFFMTVFVFFAIVKQHK